MIYQSSQSNIVWTYTSLGTLLHQVALALASERLLKTRVEIFPPEVISTVLKNSCVDDCLSKGGFRLTKWLCNDKDVLDSIPRSERTSSVLDLHLNAGVLPVERTLGVQWNVDADTLTFKITARDKPPTRRGILSATSSVYDPLGILAPFILSAKKLIQDICKRGYDESLRWDGWLSELPKLSYIAIPRNFKVIDFGSPTVTGIHHFAYASQVAYGAVSHLRFINEAKEIHCSFVTAKHVWLMSSQ